MEYDASFEKLIQSEQPDLVDFYATWCGPCQMLSPILKEVKDVFNERIAIIKIDVDKNQEIAGHFRIKGVPTMMLFQSGQQIWRQSGVLSKVALVETIMEKCSWPNLPGQK